MGADRRRLRRLVHRHRLRLGVLPELEQLGPRHRRVHARGARRRAVADQGRDQRRSGRHLSRPRLDARDRRRHLGVRRSGHAVRHHRQRVAHQPEHGAHQREQPVLGIHVPGRFGLQPVVAEPDDVRQGRRRVRRRCVSRRLPRDDHGAGNPRRQLELPDPGDRQEQPRVPSARPRLRQPRRPADVARPALRQRRRPRFRRRDHRGDDRRGLRPVGAHRRATTAVRSPATTSTASRSCA